jgi:diguanylate cyclase (GGDEF)-like protein
VLLGISSARMARMHTQDAARLEAQFDYVAARVQFLAQLQPDNFASYQYLIQAEGARMRDDFDAANKNYLAAIRHAQKYGYTLLQAQATQYLAELLRANELNFAQGLEQDAQQLYRRASCMIKVSETSMRVTRIAETTHANVSSGGTQAVDLLSVLKANEVIASEIDFDKLLLRLLSIAVENAGAQRGVLVLKQDDGFYVEADSRDGRVHEALEHSTRCPQQMILYVARSAHASTMEDGPRHTAFREDPYFLRTPCRSILACPVVRQGTLRGVVYLENNSAAGVFGYQRLEMVTMLLGSAAIALENAELYRARQRYTQELELRVSERTRELEFANQALARLADIDGLTQIANRRSFDQRCLALAASSSEVALVLCDVDDFKAYNDHYGHPSGDDVLRKIGACLASLSLPLGARAQGMVARYGGEEFVILLPNTSAEAALKFAHNANQAVYGLSLAHEHARAAAQVTLSLGVAHTQGLRPAAIAQLISSADSALYQAKHAGRNRAQLSP